MTLTMSNLPDDWNDYYHTCSRCGEQYHDSGCDECACQPCPKCDRTTLPWEWERVTVDGKSREVCIVCYERELYGEEEGEEAEEDEEAGRTLRPHDHGGEAGI